MRFTRRWNQLLPLLGTALILGACDAGPTEPGDEDPWTDPVFDFSTGAIAFETERDGNREIYLMTADGSDGINISNHPATDGDISWSPDGARLAFASDRDGNTEIYVIE